MSPPACYEYAAALYLMLTNMSQRYQVACALFLMQYSQTRSALLTSESTDGCKKDIK
jgi:hypothetical protein